MSRNKDITGQRFSRLSAVRPAGKTPSGKLTWECICDCGTVITVPTGALRSGNTRSCGCLRRDKTVARNRASIGIRQGPRADVTGQRFGRLVAVERLPSGQWFCKCDCGGSATVPVNALRSGNTRSCGCFQRDRASEANKGKNLGRVAMNRQDLVGKRFGILTVTAFSRLHVTPGGTNKTYWNCVCDCGKETTVTANNLRSGQVASCGCQQSGSSKKEQDLVDFLRQFDPEIIANRQLDGTRFRFDAISELHRIAVEFNGVFWHSTARVSREYHLQKRTVAERAGYRLISIWQDDWNDNRPRFEALLRRAFGFEQIERLHARKLTVSVLDHAQANAFHSAHHVQSGRVVGKHFALMLGEDVVEVATFLEKKGQLHLIRNTIKTGYTVVGGLRKLISATGFRGTVVSYVDRDHFDGRSYLAAGFEKVGTTLQLRYLNGSARVRREMFMRHKLPSLGIEVRDGETEREALHRAGIYQCWNSGIDRMEFVVQR